jgi:hypothetical protein
MKTLYAGMLLLAACAPQVREELYTGKAYPPTEEVDLLDAWPRDRDYEEIGTITADADPASLPVLMDRAMDLGADAVVLAPPEDRGAVTVPIGSDNAGSRLTAEPYAVSRKRVRARLLRYLP